MALLLCSMALPLQGVAADLYGPQGVKPQAVRQGKLGSCYFHAVIAALAEFQAQGLQRMIQANSDGSYTVRFADGVKENAYAEDVRYTRESGYDLSEGLWVAVLFRAYAQRVLRQSLVSGIEKSELFPFVKLYVKDFVATNDPLLLAYDRAIRSQVDQYGNIDRSKLEWQLREEMRPLSVPDAMQEAVIKLLASGGFLDSLAEVIKQKCPLLYGAGLRRERPNGHAAQSLGEVSRAGWRFHPPHQNLCARISGDYYDGVARRPEKDNTTHRRGTAQHSGNPKTKFSLPIADCRLKK
ncbi:MAG: C2 family cysteine protease [Terriglobia bacterium]|jgi:hypothetical protein